MPTLNLYTNLPVDAVVASDILRDATKAVAKIIGKPESYVMILLNQGVPIAFAGTEEPAAYGELISIGGLGPSVNGKLSATIAEILEAKLSLDSSRFYIKFYDAELALYLYDDLALNNLIPGTDNSHCIVFGEAFFFWVQWLNFLNLPLLHDGSIFPKCWNKISRLVDCFYEFQPNFTMWVSIIRAVGFMNVLL
ncbi:hypothetical protein IFM89_006824 [Coptis chinensis]|uniref:L-dopachrome isomerase n=1 Tax=Coptis chinensis TaxID=261450 RepID=A0A835M451_9MAGN|nr:hypothetical protein IFM89_006824 [Coptis chinensis]